jgi:hypothetical protein
MEAKMDASLERMDAKTDANLKEMKSEKRASN